MSFVGYQKGFDAKPTDLDDTYPPCREHYSKWISSENRLTNPEWLTGMGVSLRPLQA